MTIQWPGSDERWTATPPRPSPWSARSRRIQATIAATGSGQSRAGTVAPEVDERVAPGIALPVPGPPPADRDLDLDHRLEPVDVGTLEQADLDQAHGPGEDSKAPAAVDCAHHGRPTTAPDPTPDGRRARRACAPPSRADLPAYLADLERLVNIDCGSYTPDGVDEVGRWVGRRS